MNKLWFKAAFIRAIRTMAQAALALIGTNGIGITDVDWLAVASASALAGIVSILMSISGLPEVPTGEEIQSTFNADGIGEQTEGDYYEDQENDSEE